MVRKDQSDIVYKSENAKFEAVVDEIIAEHNKGRPGLVGTRSNREVGTPMRRITSRKRGVTILGTPDREHLESF
jgi:preprotein translocase subunit SecA